LTLTAGDSSTLQEAAGAAQYQLTLCPACVVVVNDNVSWRLHDDVKWLMMLHCGTCNTQWSLCTQCMNVRKHITTRTHLLTHCRNKHKDDGYSLHKLNTLKLMLKPYYNMNEYSSSRAPTPCLDIGNSDRFDDTSFVDIDVTNDNAHSDFAIHVRNLLINKSCYGAPQFNFVNNHSSRYFANELRHDKGKSMLVGWSQLKIEMPHDGKQFHKMEIDYHMKVAGLVSTLTFQQIHQLAEIIDESCKITRDRTLNDARQLFESQYLQTILPTTGPRIRRLYTDRNYGIIRCLPRPSVKVIGGHGYVSIRECVADLLGHGIELDFISMEKCEQAMHSGVTRMSESRHALRILTSARNVYSDMDALVLYFNEWSDDFEPMYSSKGNRGSTWVKTITIAPPPNKIHSLTYTYPIAVGRKSASHEVIEKKFADEMTELRSGKNNMFYSKVAGTQIPVFIDLFASLQDQPERRSANYIMLGGSRYAARWGHAGDFAAIASGVPGCEKCVSSLFMVGSRSTNIELQSCSQCVNWVLDVNNRLLDFPAPTNYPISELLSPNNMLHPIVITYEVMKAAVEKTHDKLSSGMWTTDNATAYLWVNGLNKEARTEVIMRATNIRTYNELRQSLDDEAFQALQRLKKQDPSAFERWQFPALWSRSTMLLQHVDVIMHLLFLGVIKTTIKHIEGWIKKRGKFDAFIKYVCGRLESVQALRLGWCKVLPYSGNKFGGWVSENYLALGKLLPWFYSTVPLLTGDPAPYKEPKGSYTKWTVKEIKYWLSNRGLPIKGRKAQLQATVHQYKCIERDTPPVIGPPGGSVGNVTDVIEMMWCMVSNAMAKTVDEDHAVLFDKHIRLFLNKFDALDKKIRQSTKEHKPKWIASYNFMCLLNLPDTMRQFGPLPNLWEGGGQGEKILTKVKPLHTGYRVGWQKNLLINILDDMALERVGSSAVCSGSFTWNDNRSDYHVYKTKIDVRSAFRRGQPMSVVQLVGDENNFWALLRGAHEMVPITVGDRVVEHLGMPYYNLVMESLNDIICHNRYTSQEVSHYCLLLPRITQEAGVTNTDGNVTESISRFNAIINSNWLCYYGINGGGFKLPVAK